MTHVHTAAPAVTPYPALDAVLASLVGGARAALGDGFAGAWLQGSFAAGCGDEASDIDFVVGVHAPVTGAQRGALQALHERLFDEGPRPWAQRLDGSYAPVAQLRRFTAPAEPWLYIGNGLRALEPSTHDNTCVVRWMLREKGLTLAGPDARDIVDPVTADDLAANVRALFGELAADWLPRPARIDTRGISGFFVTLGCRMLQTLETGVVGSKAEGAAWAAERLAPRWRPLIAMSMARRAESAEGRAAPADRAEVAEVLAFLRYAMRLAAPKPARPAVPPPARRPGRRGRRG